MGKKRVVVKIGSSSLTNAQGKIDEEKMDDHIAALAALKQANHDVVVVSSGAVAAGFTGLGYVDLPVTLKGKQAAAAVGQGLLIQHYVEKLKKYDIMPAQILLTRSDFSNQKRFQNALSTMEELLERGILPVINENDSIAVKELTFGDNDMLSALVSGMLHASQLIILTDINGIYSDNPNTVPDAERLNALESITDDMIRSTSSLGSKVGTGGMKSKLLAARRATTLGVPVFIGKGAGKQKLLDILAGNGDGTYIEKADGKGISMKRQWTGFHSFVDGTLYIDEGAEQAVMHEGASLLAPGVERFTGTFEAGDVVKVYSGRKLLGKGKVSCGSKELSVMMEAQQNGRQPEESARVIHRDYWINIHQLGEVIQ